MPRAMHRRCCWPPERPGAALLQLVFHLVPQRRLAQRPFDALVHLGARQRLEQPHAEGDVVVDRHRERRRLLEHHADLGADQADIEAAVEDVVAVEQDLALGALLRIELVHAVERAQQRRLAAARWADKGGDLALGNLQVDALERVETAVVEVQVAHRDLGLLGLDRCFRRRFCKGFHREPSVLVAEHHARQDVQAQHAQRDQEDADPGQRSASSGTGSSRT